MAGIFARLLLAICSIRNLKNIFQAFDTTNILVLVHESIETDERNTCKVTSNAHSVHSVLRKFLGLLFKSKSSVEGLDLI